VRARIAGEDRLLPVAVGRGRERLQIEVGPRRFDEARLTLPNGEFDDGETLARIARRALRDGIELRGCASCARFRLSGMSRQMSGGWSGYCGLVGFRSDRSAVEADFGCGEHEPVTGWPDDSEQAWRARQQLSDSDPRPARTSAFRGSLLGLAVGDALGFPTEFMNRAQIREAFGPEGLRGFAPSRSGHPPGSFSDDTQMSLAVAETLIATGGGSLDAMMEDLARRFVDWSRSPRNDRAPGRTTMAGCARLAAGVPWREAGIPESKGAGSAMRVAPIGLFYWRDPARVLETARASSLLTHRHDAAVEGAAAAALLVAMAMAKRAPLEMHRALMKECAPRSKDLRRCLEKLPAMLEAEPDVALSAGGLGEGWVAEEAVASALYCFWRSPEDYAQAVLTAATAGGDSDTIACIAGGISGAFNGWTSIPAPWREGVESAEEILAIADRLHAASPPAA
jgi:ADP-ribosylglycohydrolase